MGIRTVALSALCALSIVAAPAAAQDIEEPEFQLSDLHVRVDLPRGWHMTRWSTFDLKAETGDPILLQAWGSPIQTDPGDLPPEVWAPVYEERLAEMGAPADTVKLDKAEHAEVQGQKAAFLDFSFKLKSGTPAVLKGATIAVEGQMFHLALVSVKRFERKVERTRQDLMKRLEIQKGPAKVVWGPELEGDGFKHKLPDDWREPLKAENAVVRKQVASLGLDKLDGCWEAIKPVGPKPPLVMVACQGGLLLGVVDEYSFEGVEPKVREKMFGGAEVPPAEKVVLDDRVAFLYDLEDKGLAVAVVPYSKGIVRIWAKGESDQLAEAVRDTLSTSTYDGPHPASLADRVSYYLTYRPFSPVVLCPVLGLVGVGGILVIGGVAFLGLGRRDKYADLADDDTPTDGVSGRPGHR